MGGFQGHQFIFLLQHTCVLKDVLLSTTPKNNLKHGWWVWAIFCWLKPQVAAQCYTWFKSGSKWHAFSWSCNQINLQVSLGVGASDGLHVVEAEALDYEGVTTKVVLAALKMSVQPTVSVLFLGFSPVWHVATRHHALRVTRDPCSTTHGMEFAPLSSPSGMQLAFQRILQVAFAN